MQRHSICFLPWFRRQNSIALHTRREVSVCFAEFKSDGNTLVREELWFLDAPRKGGRTGLGSCYHDRTREDMWSWAVPLQAPYKTWLWCAIICQHTPSLNLSLNSIQGSMTYWATVMDAYGTLSWDETGRVDDAIQHNSKRPCVSLSHNTDSCGAWGLIIKQSTLSPSTRSGKLPQV